MNESEKKQPQAGGPEAAENAATLVDGQDKNTAARDEQEGVEPAFNCAPEKAEEFLTLLDPERQVWHFRTIGERGGRGRARHYHGSLDALLPSLIADNKNGCAVYVVMNEGGTDDRSITRCVAFFCDFDGTPLPPNFAHEPHIIVETSRKNYHVYWLADGIRLDGFKPAQQALAKKYGSDPAVCNLSRLVRLPGFIHWKRDPFLSRVIHTSGALPFNAELFHVTPTPHIPARPVHGIALRELLADALRFISADPYETWISVGQCLVHLGDEGKELWITWSKTSSKWRDEDEAKWATFTGERAGLDGIYAKARKAGWVPPSEFKLLGTAEAEQTKVALPDWPEELLSLPYGLGNVQEWILNRMMYPSRATAGVTALAVLGAFAMGHVTIKSYGGLGLNEQYLILAPTGFGKEELRSPFAHINLHLRQRMRPAGERYLPNFSFSAPASQQGLHKLLEQHNVMCFLADEFAEWLCHAATDSHKQQALGHIMQAYTKANSVLDAPFGVTNKYEQVKHPRVMIFAMSTAERMLEAMTASQADSGALNRFVIHVAEQGRIEKRYDGLEYNPSPEVVELFDWVQYQQEFVMEFSAEAYAYYKQHDSEVAEPLRFTNNVLAARLSEQAIKMAGLIALSDRRKVIEKQDLQIAYRIRESLYHRANALIAHDGAISGLHVTGKAIQQLTAAFERHPRIYRSELATRSRKYRALSAREQQDVVRALLANGIAKYSQASEVLLESLVYGRS